MTDIEKLHEKLQEMLREMDAELRETKLFLGQETHLRGKIAGLCMAIEQVQWLLPNLDTD